MSIQYSPELAALAGRPDFEVPEPEATDHGPFLRVRRGVAAAGIFFAGTFAIAGLIFIPVLFINLSRIEALEIAGRQLSVSAYLDQLGALFWGTLVLALAITSFVASLRLFASGRMIRPRVHQVAHGDALEHLAVLRLSGSER